MGAQQTIERVMKMIVNQLGGISERPIMPESGLINDIGIDSLDSIELIMALEEEFGIEIPDEDADEAITVQDVIDYVSKHVEATNAL